MVNRALPLAALLASALLVGCNSQPETVTSGAADPDAAKIAAAPKVALPPSVKSSKVYRCADSSLLYVDFFSDDLGANIRTESAGTNTRLTAAKIGDPFTGEGYTVAGTGDTVKITTPKAPAQTCNA
ncbi:hypothetical protein [Sphingomonas montana]|uniref:hypothetical protein n=1 Tax=Sphingomonas montana TaxID=1843236 RepID=UPI00096C9401|nr:hypothetical protein [Sphingomonas montana]